MICVYDSSAMPALLRDEVGADVVHAAVSAPNNEGYAHAINICEIYYQFRRDEDEDAAQGAVDTVLSLGVVVRDDLDRAFWQDLGRLKADYRRVSLADCCGVALTRRLGGAFYTADHHEVDPLAAAGECDVRFIR